jgi:hypothetical protein
MVEVMVNKRRRKRCDFDNACKPHEQWRLRVAPPPKPMVGTTNKSMAAMSGA